jgi:hypothetical protein
VLARVGDQGDEALEEGEGVEDEGPRAVAPGAAEGPLDPAVPADLEPTLGEGWAGDVANEALEAISVVGLDAGGGDRRASSMRSNCVRGATKSHRDILGFDRPIGRRFAIYRGRFAARVEGDQAGNT